MCSRSKRQSEPPAVVSENGYACLSKRPCLVCCLYRRGYTVQTPDHSGAWVPHSFGLVPHLNKMLSKILPNHGSILDDKFLIWQ